MTVSPILARVGAALFEAIATAVSVGAAWSKVTPEAFVGAVTVGPDGSIFVADGYGANYVLKFDKNRNEWTDAGTDWYRFALWGAKAEAAVEVLTKGTRVIVVGELESREYDAQDGTKRTVWEIRAPEVGVVPKAKATNGGYTASGQQSDPWAQSAQGVSDVTAPF